jgi:hypothetical protein
MTSLPPYITRELVQERLPLIFPEGTPNRSYCIREMAASTIFTMLYIGAVEGYSFYLAPSHVYRMTFEQASMSVDTDRITYLQNGVKSKYKTPGTRWYADNTREPIRDETIREGLIPLGVVKVLQNIPTTSSKPRYFLEKNFAKLFNPDLLGEDLLQAMNNWQKSYLSKSALTRISLAAIGSKNNQALVPVLFPNGETRNLSAGPSSNISKAVVEVFAHKFLEIPGLLWLSTSDNRVVAQDKDLADAIGLNIQADKDLPDIILVDLKPKDPLLVFVEVVATDGAINERRKNAIYLLTDKAGFSRGQVVFVTAYLDRESPGFKKTMSSLAWNGFAWFVSEPDKIIVLKNGISHLSKLIDIR